MATALITGASSGLGEEFARQLAKSKYDLVLVARREDRLKAVADDAARLGAAKVKVIAADLTGHESAAALHRQVTAEGLQIDYLVNNAGFGTRGRFDDLPFEREMEEIELNVTALVALTRLFLPPMVSRRSGTIINVSSVGGFTPVPFMATYGATKAFVLSFSEALAEELKDSGVTVMALCPGATRTEFQKVANVEEARMPSFAFMNADTVVTQAIAAAKRGKSVCVNGPMNKIMVESTRFTPRRLVAKIAGSMFRV
jgi:short-subunit dehydrogenase